jgi:hypothetical protein
MRAVLGVLVALACPAFAHAATYEVGPGKPYPNLQAVAGSLDPGDVVNVHPGSYSGGVVLDRDGAPGNAITIRGVGSSRPALSGGTNTIEIAGDHHVVERLDVSGGTARCFYHHAHDVVLRDTVIHDCPAHGLLGADDDSGSLLADGIEVARSGDGDREHSIYMATDEDAHPGSVFTLRHSVVHSSTGGNAIKSRAERNVIAYNRIEANTFQALELIGPDPAGGTAEGTKREDSDVVGNVLVGGPFGALIRVGGDATGQSHGRYRFAFNTMLSSSSTSVIFRAFDALDSIEAHGNVIAGGAGSGNVIRETEADWETSPRGVGGDRNWVRDGWAVPPEWTNTLRGADPGFEPGTARPAAGSPLLDAGPASTSSPPGHEFPGPLFPPAMHPPSRAALAPVEARPPGAPLDIGAYERGTGAPPGSGAPAGGLGPASPSAARRPAITQRGRVRVLRRRGRLLVETGQTVRCPTACRATVEIRRARLRSSIAEPSRELQPGTGTVHSTARSVPGTVHSAFAAQRRRGMLLARRSFRVRAGRSVRVRLSLSRRGARLLRRARRLRATSRVTVRAPGAGSLTRQRTISLRLP